MRILNASGCLDALAASELARTLDASQNGETHGSPVRPLLYDSPVRASAWAALGRSPAPPAERSVEPDSWKGA